MRTFEHAALRLPVGSRARAAAALSPINILRLQHTIGNKAVQRLVVQRAPAGGNKAKSEEIPAAVASITLGGDKLEGESRVPGHEGKIEVFSIGFAGSGKAGGSGQGRGGSDRAAPESETQFEIVKPLDRSSPKLSAAAANGLSVSEAEFQLISRDEAGAIQTRATYAMLDGIVTGIQYGGQGSGAREVESVSFSFRKWSMK